MSSSVFSESNIQDSWVFDEDIKDKQASADSNLVVVYSKRGVNFDHKGLENLIEEKTLSSISIIRLTSPTPSMENEEEKAEKLEEMLRKQNLNSDEDSSNENSNNVSTEDEEPQITDGDVNYSYEEDSTDDVDDIHFDKRRINRSKNLNGKKNLRKALKHKKENEKERPEIVGLTVEEFYPPSAAKEVARSVLKAAGLPIVKSTAEYEFQMYVIRNDHCYTPFTSPEQMKAKLEAEKLAAEKRTVLIPSRKVIPISSPTVKPQTIKKNSQQLIQYEKYETKEEKNKQNEQESYSNSSVINNEFEIDIDSFDVKNRGQAIKLSTTKKGNNVTSFKNQNNHNVQLKNSSYNNASPSKNSVFSSINGTVRNNSKNSGTQLATSSTTTQMPGVKTTLATNQKKLPIVLINKTHSIYAQHFQNAEKNGSGLIKRMDTQNEAQPRTINDIKINKILAIPKRGFTEISSLIPTSTTQSVGNIISTNLYSRTNIVTENIIPIKNENSVSWKLSPQTPIKANQNVLEVNVKNKQLNVIESNVKNKIVKQNQNTDLQKNNQNIPQLVKMLESAGEAMKNIDSFTTSIVENIDISNAPLLNNDIPEDLLQDVVELIKDDKTLQDAVDKEMFGKDSNKNGQTLKPAVDINLTNSYFDNKSESQVPKNKSIIQIAIDNVPTSTPIKEDSSISEMLPSCQETVQIVRGNGRVITLPPIEAPTTRAKRRLQTNLFQNVSKSKINNSSLNTSAESLISKKDSDTCLQEQNSSDVSSKMSTVKNDSATVSSTTSRSSRKNSGKKLVQSQKSQDKTDTKNNTNSDAKDDDDPKKLWCICRQPHNNRFMICCDMCEDWFHGTCVNVTKAMGIEMEQKGMDWTCPNCAKKSEEKKQRKITDMFEINKKANSDTIKILNDTLKNEEKLLINKEENNKKLLTEETKNVESDFKQSDNLIKNSKKLQESSPLITSGQKKYFAPPNTKIISKSLSPQLKTDVTFKDQSAQKTINQQQTKSLKSTTVTTKIAKEDQRTLCIVCKKLTRQNSIYCSDDCIRKYANHAIQIYSPKSSDSSSYVSPIKKIDDKKKGKGLFEEFLSMADFKPKCERVNVFERKSGRLITGNNAPTTANLKKWLQDNPTFEIVQPGSSQAFDIEKRQKKSISSHTSPNHKKIPCTSPIIVQSQLNPMTMQNQIKTSTPILKKQDCSNEKIKLPVPKTNSSEQEKHNLNSSNQVQKLHHHQTFSKLDKSNKSDYKDFKEDSKSKDKLTKGQNQKKTESNEIESTRKNVQRTLKDLLLQRMKDLTINGDIITNILPTTADIEKFVEELEDELYNFFNRDTGAKYKSKYRSIIFNIRDQKNRTLITKIFGKLIGPKQLVRMSPEEMASQELAQWRENEAKHQLEIIKKSEMDLLSSSKNYVLKSHKGEEVIEAKESLDLNENGSTEELISSINNSSSKLDDKPVLDSTLYVSSSISTINSSVSGTYSASSQNEEKYIGTKFSIQNTKFAKEKEKISDNSQERQNRSKDRHKEKFKSRKRSRSLSNNRSRSRSQSESQQVEKKQKISYNDDIREKERHDNETEHTFKKEKNESNRKIEKNKKSTANVHYSKTVTTEMHNMSGKEHAEIHSTSTLKKKSLSKTVDTFNLVDQILESSKTVEEAANFKSDKESTLPTKSCFESISIKKTVALSHQNSFDSDQEPTSTVSIPTPPHDPYIRYSGLSSEKQNIIWNGNVTMFELTSFYGKIKSVIGNSLNLENFMPEDLDIIGRIGSETVWDYISKIKKSPNKEIVIVNLMPSCEAETAAYTVLYNYLDKRDRLGVIKSSTPQIKDFYLYPLGAGKSMPSILQPLEKVDFYDDPYRPDVLIGIIIRVIGKRTFNIPSVFSNTSVTSKSMFPHKTSVSDSLTPPGSPKRKKVSSSITVRDDEIDLDAIIKAPISSKSQISIKLMKKVDDSNEPYSPGGSSDEEGQISSVKTSKTDDDLKRKMDELNRQIAAQEMEIAGLLNVEKTRSVSSSATSTSVLANIAIPSNLSQILASIQKKGETHDTSYNSGDTDKYKMNAPIFQSYKKDKPSTSLLAQLSEAELLNMVSDNLTNQTAPNFNQPSKESKQRSEEPPPPGV